MARPLDRNLFYIAIAMRLFRFLKISSVVIRYGLDEFLPNGFSRSLIGGVFFWRTFNEPRGVRLRLALETLGPIFIKFGQLLSTRPDLVPSDIAIALAKLQDQVPPFAAERVIETLNRVYQRPYQEVFSEFNLTPVASASIAQVHFGVLADGKFQGREVAIKILRPNIRETIDHDIALLYVVADLVEATFEDGKRLRSKEVVAEFENAIHDELDLVREAANASTLRRNFADGTLLYVPQVYFDYTHREVMVMERIDAIRICIPAIFLSVGMGFIQGLILASWGHCLTLIKPILPVILRLFLRVIIKKSPSLIWMRAGCLKIPVWMSLKGRFGQYASQFLTSL